jgi:hypothetical protein
MYQHRVIVLGPKFLPQFCGRIFTSAFSHVQQSKHGNDQNRQGGEHNQVRIHQM